MNDENVNFSRIGLDFSMRSCMGSESSGESPLLGFEELQKVILLNGGLTLLHWDELGQISNKMQRLRSQEGKVLQAKGANMVYRAYCLGFTIYKSKA